MSDSKRITDLFDLSGKVAIVTGAGSGLGAVFAGALADAGAAVVASDLNLEGAEATVARLEASGARALAIAANMAREEDVIALVERTVAELGRVDILVNNAGIGAVAPPEDMSLEDWQRVIDVNLTGVFLGAREAAKAMIAAGNGGRIINIASILGAGASIPVPAAPYAASKAAVINLTRDLAVHWAPYGILVNAIGPAYFGTAMTQGLIEIPEMRAAIEGRTPLGRLGQPEELRGPIVFLASEASSYITGHTLFVDGGWTAM